MKKAAWRSSTHSSREGFLPFGAIAVAAALFPTGIMAQTEPMDPEMEAVRQQSENGDGAELIEQVEAAASSLSDGVNSRLAELRSRPTSEAVELVRLDLEALAEPRVAVNSTNAALTMVKSDEEPADGGTVWYGTIGDGGQAVLVVKGEEVTGNLRTEQGLFELRPVGDGLHAVIKVNPAEFPEEHPPEWEDIEQHEPEGGDDSTGSHDESSSGATGDNTAQVQMRELDILVAYTPAADDNVSDMDALIALAIAENNLANRNSDVSLRVSLVDSFEVDYTESGNFFTDVARFRNDGDGFMDEVHDRRDQSGADMAVLIMDNGQYCGLASAIRATEVTAFAGVHYTCATGNFTFAHELGHLQGARHNPQADPTTTPFAYGHGYYRIAQQDRTVMSYNCASGCTRKAYWSNPNVSVLGEPMGTAATNDNARVLNLTAAEVTNFRSPPASGATGFAWANQPSSPDYSPSTMYAHNSANAPVRIARSNPGVYSVRFSEMGGKGTYGGNVQVTPWGSSSDLCKVSSWSSGGTDFVATVRCFSSAGTPKDSYFSILVRWP